MQKNFNCLAVRQQSQKTCENKINSLSQVITKRTVEAAGINAEAPIVTALIGNLNGTLPTKKTDEKHISCKICNCTLTSNIIFERHVSGAKHQKKLKTMEFFSKLNYGDNNEVKVLKNSEPFRFMCKICPMSVNSVNQLFNHLSGEKHRKKVNKLNLFALENHKIDETVVAGKNADPFVLPKPKGKKLELTFPCVVCNVSLNSKIQQNEHFLSKKHKSKEAIRQRLQRALEEKLLPTEN